VTGLVADVRTRAGGFVLDVHLEARPGELVVILGPNGAGKTTLLRALAGLLPLASGRVVLDGAVLEDAERREWVRPERRPVGVVFQDYLLFPRLSALDNVAFGLHARSVSRREARRRASEWLYRVGLKAQEGARPDQLSGGQAQRVALARALATEPRLLLLDEPLSALDATSRRVTRRELCRHLATFDGARLLVTHDPLEAMVLADRVVILEEGGITQQGRPGEIAARPRSPYAADLVGVNLLRGRAGGGGVALDTGGRLVVAGPASGEVLVVIHPRAVALHRARPRGTPRNVWAGTIDGVDPEGDRVRVRVAGPVPVVAEITRSALTELELTEGDEVWVAVKATEIVTYPA
jgi:molybdate transport system ATP-binding protein